MQASLLSLLSCICVGALVPTDQPVLMRVVFAPSTTASAVRDAIDAYPVCDLPGAPTATTAEDGAQLMLWRAPPEGESYASEVKRRSRCEIDRLPYAGGESVADGGMAFRISTDGAVALEASRVVADPDEPKVIREKQLCKKMLAWLEDRVECTSSSLRPVGSGSF